MINFDNKKLLESPKCEAGEGRRTPSIPTPTNEVSWGFQVTFNHLGGLDD
jgi:hypothetical protein